VYIFLIAIGLFLVVITPISLKVGEISKTWLTTQGNVISSEVEQEKSVDLDDSESVHYYPRIRYKYKVEGQTFQSRRVKILDASMIKLKAQEYADQFLPNNKVAVYYNPIKPEEAVLQTGAQNFLYVFLIMGVGLILAGIVQCMNK
jgi:hypothetical protein